MICIFKCVSCGDRMHFSVEKQLLECSTCGSTCEMENYNMDDISYEGAVTMDSSIKKLYCPSCGAKVGIKEGSAKLNCGYCQSELAAFGVNDDSLSPEKIIPCKITEEEAKGKLYSWWIKHSTMPKLDPKKLKMEFHDMYVPVWLVDTDVVTDVAARIEGYYDNISLPHHHLRKKVRSPFNHVPFDASCHIQDDQFYNIEPFDYSEMKDFNAGYLSGHMAEVYHIGPDQTIPRIIGRVKEFAIEECKSDIEVDSQGGTILEVVHQECDVTPKNITYLLVPVWVCKYIYQGKKRYVYINGQTGKVDGEVLFASKSRELDIAEYSLATVWLSGAVGILIAATFLCGLPSLLEALIAVGTFCLISFQITVSAAGQNKSGRVNSNEEIQLRQGMRVSSFSYSLFNAFLAIVVTIFDSMISVPRIIASGKIPDCAVLSSVIAIVLSLLMIFSFVKKLTHYQTFIKKTRYMDYIKVTEYVELMKQTW